LINETPQPSEVVDARGGHAVLGGRLNEVDAQLAEKVKKGDLVINIKDYGAKGDGTTNDTSAFASAFSFLKTEGGGMIVVPEGEYVAYLDIPSYCGVTGTGKKSIIKLPNNANRPVIQLESENTQFIHLSHLSVNGNKAGQTSSEAKGVLLKNQLANITNSFFPNENDGRHYVDNLYIYNTLGNGFEVHGRGESQINNVQVRKSNEHGFAIYSADNWFTNLSSGVNTKSGFYISANNCRFINTKAWNNGEYNPDTTTGFGFEIVNCNGIVFSGVEAQSNLNHGVYLNNTRNSSFVGVVSELNGKVGDLVFDNVAGFYINNSKFNLINGSGRNMRDVYNPQSYMLTLKGDVKHNIISLTGDSMLKGGLLDTDLQLSFNDIAVKADLVDYTDVSMKSKQFNYVGIGGTPLTYAPFYALGDDTHSQTAFIRKNTTELGTNKTLSRFALYSSDGVNSAVFDIQGNITNNQILFNTNGKEARFTNRVKSNDKVIANLGLGVGNSVSATTLGSVAKKMEVFDVNGTSIGFVPIYSSIT
jgi:hypothetical protein